MDTYILAQKLVTEILDLAKDYGAKAESTYPVAGSAIYVVAKRCNNVARIIIVMKNDCVEVYTINNDIFTYQGYISSEDDIFFMLLEIKIYFNVVFS